MFRITVISIFFLLAIVTVLDESDHGNSAFALIDATKPTISITDPTNNANIQAGSYVVTGTTSDTGSGVKSVQVKINSGSLLTATPKAPGDWSTWTVTVTFSQIGSNYIAAKAIDNAGNYQVSRVIVNVVKVGTITPIITITFPINNAQLNNNKPTIQGTSSDSGSGVKQVQVSMDSGTYTLATGTTSWSYTSSSSLSSGSHTVTAKATDNAGNVATASTTFTVNTIQNNSGVIFDFLVRNQGIPDADLSALYSKHSKSTDIVTDFTAGLLSTTITSQVAGQKSTTYFSLADLQANAANLHSLGYTWIAYDLEASYSPASEWANPVASIQQAGQIAHSNGLKLLISPAGISPNDYTSMAQYTDAWVLQAMDAIAVDSTAMSNTVHTAVAKIKSGNPNEIVILQDSVNLDTVDQMNKAWDMTKDVVNGITIFYSNSTQIPQMAQVLTHVDGIN